MKNNVRGSSFRSARVLIAIALASMMLAGGSTALADGDKAGGMLLPRRADTRSLSSSPVTARLLTADSQGRTGRSH